jgi:hypothetical protein
LRRRLNHGNQQAHIQFAPGRRIGHASRKKHHQQRAAPFGTFAHERERIRATAHLATRNQAPDYTLALTSSRCHGGDAARIDGSLAKQDHFQSPFDPLHGSFVLHKSAFAESNRHRRSHDSLLSFRFRQYAQVRSKGPTDGG